MKINLFIFIIISLLSFNSYGSQTVEKLIENPDKLSQKINILDSILQKELESTKKQELDVLKWRLIDIKNNLHNLNNNKAIAEAINYARSKSWDNTLAMLNKIKATCSVVNKMGNECFVEISEFDTFLESRNISNVEKMKLKVFLDEFLTFIQAKLIINDGFLKTINHSLLKFDNLINVSIKPLVSIKLSTPVLNTENKVTAEKKEVALVQNNESFLFSQIFLLRDIIKISLFTLFFIITYVFVKKIYIKRTTLKNINDFYKSILYQNHKNKLKTKMFGQIGINEYKKLNHIKNSYVHFIELLGPFKSAMDIKFKKNDETFIIETLLYTTIPMQQYLNSENHIPFLQGVTKLNEMASQIAGKVFITNSFDQTGNIVSSKIIISL